MYRNTARPAVFIAATERPHHHAVSLFNNYGGRHDLDHLILQIAQRTTGAGRSIRLGRSNLAGIWRWLSSTLADGVDISGGLDQTHVQVVPIGLHTDVVVLSIWTDEQGQSAGILISIVHRADAENASTARVVLGWDAAMILRDAIDRWIQALVTPVIGG
jgi:hypothetical protein